MTDNSEKDEQGTWRSPNASFDELVAGAAAVPNAIEDEDEEVTPKDEGSNRSSEVHGEDDDVPPLQPIISRIISGRTRRLSSSSRFSAGANVSRTLSRRMSSTQSTEFEMMLRSVTRESGFVSVHDDGPVRAHKAEVDLGNGPEWVVIVDWMPNDPGNPYNWSPWRKSATLWTVCFITALTAINATSTGVMGQWGQPYFGVSHMQWTLVFFVYLFACAITPLVLAPLSEVFGRNMIYQVTSILTAILFIPQIWGNSFPGLLAARWFQGMASSVGNSMAGGTVADIYLAKDRGGAMNIFTLFIFAGQSLGGVIFGWVGMKLGLQWCYGIQAIATTVSCVINLLILRETRADVLLARRAAKLTKESGMKHMAAAEIQKQSFISLLTVSCVRPLQYLFTEPIVTAVSLWIGFAWGCIMLGSSSTLLVFRQYGWNAGLTGMSLICTLVGAVLGYAANYHQEYLYTRAAEKSSTGRAPPEARLYWAATGGLLFPIGMYVYAWTGVPSIHWIVPSIFLSLSMCGVYVMYSSVFNYFADAYEIYSSSAQASQSFVRNTFSAIFPLFATQMYNNMGYPQASTLVAALGTVLGIAPVALIFFGAGLRAKSKVASALAKSHE